MGALIDASVLIAAEHGLLDQERVLARPGSREGPLAIAVITAAEVLHGLHRVTGARRVAAEGFARTWLGVFPVVSFDLEVARVHATLGAQLSRTDAPVGAHDLMIAATALHLGYRVATRDRRSFHLVEGLEVAYW